METSPHVIASHSQSTSRRSLPNSIRDYPLLQLPYTFHESKSGSRCFIATSRSFFGCAIKIKNLSRNQETSNNSCPLSRCPVVLAPCYTLHVTLLAWPFDCSLQTIIHRLLVVMLGSRSWRALMLRNVIYRQRNWLGTVSSQFTVGRRSMRNDKEKGGPRLPTVWNMLLYDIRHDILSWRHIIHWSFDSESLFSRLSHSSASIHLDFDYL